ncbi:MAG: hypothetical protein RL701_6047 [Pseudomonadota bacterium]|jgi:hypothetical protein
MSTRSYFTSTWLVFCLAVCANASACVTVHPYERESLTRPGMDTHGESMVAEFEAHVQSAREGAIGGRSTVESTGGGCGCN